MSRLNLTKLVAAANFPPNTWGVWNSSSSYQEKRTELYQDANLYICKVCFIHFNFWKPTVSILNRNSCVLFMFDFYFFPSYILCTFPSAFLSLNDKTNFFFPSTSFPAWFDFLLYILAMAPFATNPLLYVVSDINYRRWVQTIEIAGASPIKATQRNIISSSTLLCFRLFLLYS